MAFLTRHGVAFSPRPRRESSTQNVRSGRRAPETRLSSRVDARTRTVDPFITRRTPHVTACDVLYREVVFCRAVSRVVSHRVSLRVVPLWRVRLHFCLQVPGGVRSPVLLAALTTSDKALIASVIVSGLRQHPLAPACKAELGRSEPSFRVRPVSSNPCVDAGFCSSDGRRRKRMTGRFRPLA
jgi:hypothetical protein